MQKKLVVVMMLIMSMMVFSNEGVEPDVNLNSNIILTTNESVEIEKEVTGVDRQILETSDKIEDVDGIQEGQLQKIDVDLKTDDLKTSNETLVVEQQVADNDLEDELSKGMSSDKSWLRYILGAVLLIAGVAAF